MNLLHDANFVFSGAFYPKSDNPDIPEEFSFKDRFGEDVHMYHELGDYYVVPRRCAPKPPIGTDTRVVGTPIVCENNFVGRYDQEEVVDNSVALLNSDESHIIQADTGYGKTIIGAALIARMKVKTLILTTESDNLDDWVNSLKIILGDVKIGLWRADKTPDADCVAVVGLIQSVMKGPDRYGPDLYQDFGLVICDEVHRMGADKFSQAMWFLPAKHRIGLSATVNRKDGRQKLFKAHIGPVKVKGKFTTLVPKVIRVQTTFRVPRTHDEEDNLVQIEHSPGKTAHIFRILKSNKPRNATIIKYVKAGAAKGRNIIVFSDTIKHLQMLMEQAVKAGVPEGDIGLYAGTANYKGGAKKAKAAQQEAKERQVVFTTYTMAATGTNIPRLDMAILAAPKSGVIQAIGRIRRILDGKPVPVVVDFVDDDSPVFDGYARSRLKYYKSLGCEIKEYTIDKHTK